MANIPLRTYVEQLDNLIERKQVDEVIAHCRHILGLYPKHLDTYRMLGKALLEKGRHGDAADIFQRVLSVMPDDFISHVGMSIVREDEANLDAAIWHMERAFESSPANGAIQQELCRLYGRRDGVVPAKARLTRGALARMYAQGGLYLQAEAELKAALEADADRIDLLTKLADVYWQTDQPAQAAQTSAAIIQKLPYSLEANRILVNVFRVQGRPNDATIYRQRLEALDPYEAFADPAANGAGAARVDAARVPVARLEYVPGMESSGSPDWLASIGAKFEEPVSARAADSQPDWLQAAGEPASDMPAADYQPGQGSVPDWLKDMEAGPSDAQPSASPDWLQALGAASEAPANAPNTSDEGLPDWITPTTGPLPANAVPDWMLPGATAEAPVETGTAPLPGPDESTAAPPAPVAATQPASSEAAPLVQSEAAGELPDWLKSTVADENEEDLPDWLKAITAQPMPAAAGEPPTTAESSIPPAEIPEWLKGAAPDDATLVRAPSGSTADVPEWLQTAASTPAGTGPLPDWLKAATGELDPGKAAGSAVTEHPLAPVSPESAAVPAAPPATPVVSEAAPAASEAALSVEPATLAAQPAATTAESQGVDALPEWLKPAAEAGAPLVSAAPTQPAVSPTVPAADGIPAANGISAAAAPWPLSAPEPEPSAIPQPTMEMPDWLKTAVPAGASLAEAAEPASAAPAPPAATVPPTEPVAPPTPDELPDWLQAAAVLPPQAETPAWLQTAPAGPSLVSAQSGQEPEIEIPDWLKDLAESAPPSAGQPAQPGAVSSGGEPPAAEPQPVELPDFLQIASPEAIARAEQPFELEPEADEPAAILPAEIPDWLKALAPSPDPGVPASTLPTAIAAEAAAGASLEDSLGWMDELTAGAATMAEASSEEPAWLAAPEPTASEAGAVVPGGLAQDTLAAEIPPWAQNEEPGPTDTIASWLAGKHVPDWLRQPASETPGLPAVEWEPDSVPATDSLSASTQPAEAPQTVPAAAAEPAQAAAPELESIDSEAAFRWLESLAAQQGANPEELFTTAAEPAPAEGVAPAALASAEQPPTGEGPAEPQPPIEIVAEAAQVPTPGQGGAEPASLEEFLRQAETTLVPDHLAETAPRKKLVPSAAEPAAPEALAPVPPGEPAAPPPAEPVTASVATGAEPPAAGAEFDADAALRWLEGLAAQQGANPEELLTPPEERTLEAPQWVAAEQAAAEQSPAEPTSLAPEPASSEAPSEPPPAVQAEAIVTQAAVETAAPSVMQPVEPAETLVEAPPTEYGAEPAAVSEATAPDAEADAALRWLEGLAAQQGANPEELMTAPEERTLQAPAWITAQAAAEAMATPEEPEAEAVPATPAAAEEEPEPAEPEPAPAASLEAPDWLKELEPVEKPTASVPAPAEPEPAPPAAEPEPAAEPGPPSTPEVADLDKLSRLAERLAAARRAREVEMEARFAEQRAQQEAARRWMEERMEGKHAEPEPASEAESVLAPAPQPAEPPAAEPVTGVAAEAPRAPSLAPAPAAHPHPRPSIRARRSRPAAVVSSPTIAAAPTLPSPQVAIPADTLARGQAALSGQDYATAVTHLSLLVEQGQHLDTVVQSLESAAGAERAPVPLLRLLGDAYLRTDQLQKALDTYRQALGRL